MTRAELERKFTDLVVPKFGRDKAAQLQSLLQIWKRPQACGP